MIKIIKKLGICLCVMGIICLMTACGSQKETKIDIKQSSSAKEITATATENKELQKVEKTSKEKDVQNTPDATRSSVEEVVVYVCGAVKNPGVYSLIGNCRMVDAVKAAGGTQKDADLNVLNLAQYVSDGQMIRIPVKGENIDSFSSESLTGDKEDTSLQSFADGSKKQGNAGESGGKVDLNTADETVLMTIPGVGQSKADAIINYRKEHGRFESIEEIMQISGIKEASFEKMKPYICVK